MKTRNTITRMLAALIVVVGGTTLVAAHTHSHSDTNAFETALVPYEAIHKALAGDTLDGVADNARTIADLAGDTAEKFSAGGAGVSEAKATQCKALLPKIESGATRVAAAKTLDEAREAFGELSGTMVQWREMATGERPKVAFCPMVKKKWLQESDQIANPYFGTKMLKCGSIVSE